MTIESIKARLDDRCAQCPLMPGIPLCRECPDADLRALLRVAEATKAAADACPVVPDFCSNCGHRHVCDALAELEGMQ